MFSLGKSSGSVGAVERFPVCNICGRQFGTKSLSIHQKQCLRIRGKPGLVPNSNGLKLNSSTFDISRFNNQALKDYETNALSTGQKSECPNCHRSFGRPEGLEKHRVLCDRSIDSKVFSRNNDSVSISKKIKNSPVNINKPKLPGSNVDIIELKLAISSGKVGSRESEALLDKTNPAADIKNKEAAVFCYQCGFDFKALSSVEKWNFCPKCGKERLSI